MGTPFQAIVFFSLIINIFQTIFCPSFPPLVKSMSQSSPHILSTTIPFPSLTFGSCLSLEMVAFLCCPVHFIWVAQLWTCICMEWCKRSLFPFPSVSHFCAAMKICPACVILFLSLAQVRHLHVWWSKNYFGCCILPGGVASEVPNTSLLQQMHTVEPVIGGSVP